MRGERSFFRLFWKSNLTLVSLNFIMNLKWMDLSFRVLSFYISWWQFRWQQDGLVARWPDTKEYKQPHKKNKTGLNFLSTFIWFRSSSLCDFSRFKSYKKIKDGWKKNRTLFNILRKYQTRVYCPQLSALTDATLASSVSLALVRETETCYKAQLLVQLYRWFKFYFHLCLGLTICDNEFDPKENKIHPENKISLLIQSILHFWFFALGDWSEIKRVLTIYTNHPGSAGSTTWDRGGLPGPLSWTRHRLGAETSNNFSALGKPAYQTYFRWSYFKLRLSHDISPFKKFPGNSFPVITSKDSREF